MPDRRPFLTEPDDFTDVSRGKPSPAHPQGRGPRQGPAHRRDLAAGDRRRGRRPRSRSRARLDDGTALDLAALLEAGRGARRPVPEGDAVQQHRPAARPGALGGRAAPRGPRGGRQGRATSAASTSGASTTTTRSRCSARRWRSTRCSTRRRASCRRSSPTGSTAAPIPLERGGPVRMVVPWAHGFKSIKWLQRIVADERLPGERHLRPAEQRPRVVPEDGGLPRRRRRADVPGGQAGRDPGHGDGRLVGAGAGRILAAARGRRRTERSPTTTRPGRPPSGSPAPSTRRPTTGAAACPKACCRARSGASAPTASRRSGRCAYSIALWSATLDGLEAGRLRVPRPDRRQERLRAARAAALPEVGPERGRVQAVRRHGLTLREGTAGRRPRPGRRGPRRCP